MTRQIFILLTVIFFAACSTDNQPVGQTSAFPSDTTLTFLTSSQQLKISVGENGEIKSLEINPDVNSQTLYFDKEGYVDIMTIRKEKKEEHTLLFNTNGQLRKVKSYDVADTNGGDQFIWFANSNSKSLLIDYDKSHVPIVCGLLDTFEINKKYVLSFRTINTKSDSALIEIQELYFDSLNLTANIDKKKPSFLTISSQRKGSYRIRGVVSTTFLKPEPNGILNKIDFNVTFK